MQQTTATRDLTILGLQDQLDAAWAAFFALNGQPWDVQGPAARRVCDLRQQIETLGGTPR
jgi:hypothetical protein